MKIFAFQFDICWECPDENLRYISSRLNSDYTDGILVLPEMWNTGFTMKPEIHAEPAFEGTAFRWMNEFAKSATSLVCGSVAVRVDDGIYKNRFYAVFPDGSIQYYDKKHCFTLAGEHQYYTPGNKKIIFNYRGWNICPIICYDLRFPVWCRNTLNPLTERLSYDILIVVANWPEARRHAWRQLLIARAIENQSYVLGVNRIGQDGNGIAHCGDTMFINPFGEIVAEATPGKEAILCVEPDRELLDKCRTSFPFWKDADSFTLGNS